MSCIPRRNILEIFRYSPVQRNIAERSLCAPATRDINAEDKRLNRLLHLVIREMFHLHIRRQIGVEARECLCACPFILQNAKEIYHLITKRHEVLRRSRRNFPRNTADAIFNDIQQIPSRTIPGQIPEIMNVYRTRAIHRCDLRIDSIVGAQPVFLRN